MSNAAPSTPTPETSEALDAPIYRTELPWPVWNDAAGFGTLYQMGYDAWKTWADMQLSMIDACWKMGCLTLDLPSSDQPRPADDDTAADRVRLEVRLKKVAGGG